MFDPAVVKKAVDHTGIAYYETNHMTEEGSDVTCDATHHTEIHDAMIACVLILTHSPVCATKLTGTKTAPSGEGVDEAPGGHSHPYKVLDVKVPYEEIACKSSKSHTHDRSWVNKSPRVRGAEGCAFPSDKEPSDTVTCSNFEVKTRFGSATEKKTSCEVPVDASFLETVRW